MGKSKTNGLIITVLGIILACCLCPLLANYAVLIGTGAGSPVGAVSPYGQLFSARVGNWSAVTLIVFVQLTCAFLLAILTAVFGFLVSRSRAT